jgi:hypothetical protein
MVIIMESNTNERAMRALGGPGVVVDPGMCGRSLYGNREIGAADKAAILLVKVQPHQLLVLDA